MTLSAPTLARAVQELLRTIDTLRDENRELRESLQDATGLPFVSEKTTRFARDPHGRVRLLKR